MATRHGHTDRTDQTDRTGPERFGGSRHGRPVGPHETGPRHQVPSGGRHGGALRTPDTSTVDGPTTGVPDRLGADEPSRADDRGHRAPPADRAPRRWPWLVAGGLALLLVGFVLGRVSVPTPSVTATPTVGTPSAAAPVPSPAAARTAQQVVADLAAKVPSAKPGQVITAQNDPNKLLGRPGQYTSAAVFTDSRIPKEDQSSDKLSSDNGGKVEVFASAEQAQRRSDYLQKIAEATPIAAEYDYASGTVLVRVSKSLSPTQAKQYQDALGAG